MNQFSHFLLYAFRNGANQLTSAGWSKQVKRGGTKMILVIESAASLAVQGLMTRSTVQDYEASVL